MLDKKSRIYIVEDHPLICAGLAQLIAEQSDLEICGQSGEAGKALNEIIQAAPDVAIIDLTLKEGSGLDLIRQIRALDGKTRILVSSMHDEQIYAERCLHAGAMGYIMKQEDTGELIEAIRRILKGNVYLSARMADRMMLNAAGRNAGSNGSGIERLTDREMQVLDLIGRGKTTAETAKHLHLSVKTIETHRENMKKKLGLASGAELVRFAITVFVEERATLEGEPSEN